MTAADRVLRRGLAGRRAQLTQRLQLMLVSAAEDDESDDRRFEIAEDDEPDDRFEIGENDESVDRFAIALELLYDEFEFLAALEREVMQAEIQVLELKAIERRWL